MSNKASKPSDEISSTISSAETNAREHLVISARSRAGFTLLEAVVSITVFAVGIVGILQLNLAAKASSDKARDTVQVANYLQEGLEAVRTIRDSAWTNVNTDAAYHLNPVVGANPPWQLIAGGTETVGKYTRTVAIAPVIRQDTDGSGTLTAGDKIVTTGGTLADAETKLITVTLTWRNGSQTLTRTMFEYLTNWQT